MSQEENLYDEVFDNTKEYFQRRHKSVSFEGKLSELYRKMSDASVTRELERNTNELGMRVGDLFLIGKAAQYRTMADIIKQHNDEGERSL